MCFLYSTHIQYAYLVPTRRHRQMLIELIERVKQRTVVTCRLVEQCCDAGLEYDSGEKIVQWYGLSVSGRSEVLVQLHLHTLGQIRKRRRTGKQGTQIL